MKKLLLLIPIFFFACNSHVEFKQTSSKASIRQRRIDMDIIPQFGMISHRYVSNGMLYEVNMATTGNSYGAVVINTINLTKDSLECAYYRIKITSQ